MYSRPLHSKNVCMQRSFKMDLKGFSKVIIESDCAEVINALQGKVMDNTYRGIINMEAWL